MNEMAYFRRSGALLLLAALFALVNAAVAPLAAASCERRSGCPVCPMMAKRGAPCHVPASGGMTAPIGCCEGRATVALSTPIPAVGPAPAQLPVLVASAVETLSGSPVRQASNRQTLGLFTLHSVWRI